MVMAGAYSSLTLTVPAAYADYASDLFAELGTLGCEVSGDDPVSFVAYFEGRDNLDALQRVVRSRLADLGVTGDRLTISRTITEPADWAAKWRRSLHPVRVGRTWLVRPSWLRSDGFDRITLVIEPKMAFGTGTHATTQLCLLEIEDLVRPGMSVLDVGTGTGILAIAAAKLGAEPVTAVEIDPEAVAYAEENLALNDVRHGVSLVAGTLCDAMEHAADRVDLVVANIEYGTLVRIGRNLRDRTEADGLAIMSGILQLESQAFGAELRHMGWRIRRIRRQFDPMTNEAWVSYVLAPR